MKKVFIILLATLSISCHSQLNKHKKKQQKKKTHVEIELRRQGTSYNNIIYNMKLTNKGKYPLVAPRIKIILPEFLLYERARDETNLLPLKLPICFEDLAINQSREFQLRFKNKITAKNNKSTANNEFTLDVFFPTPIYLNRKFKAQIAIDNKSKKVEKFKVIAFLNDSFEYINSSPKGLLKPLLFKPKFVITSKNCNPITISPNTNIKLHMLIWNLASIKNGSKKIEIHLRAVRGGFTNSFVKITNAKGSQHIFSKTVIQSSPAIEISTSGRIVKKKLRYLIKYRNRSESLVAKNLILEHSISNNANILKIKSPIGYKIKGNNIIFDSYPKLKFWESISIEVLGEVLLGNEVRYKTILSGSNFDTKIDENEFVKMDSYYYNYNKK